MALHFDFISTLFTCHSFYNSKSSVFTQAAFAWEGGRCQTLMLALLPARAGHLGSNERTIRKVLLRCPAHMHIHSHSASLTQTHPCTFTVQMSPLRCRMSHQRFVSTHQQLTLPSPASWLPCLARPRPGGVHISIIKNI